MVFAYIYIHSQWSNSLLSFAVCNLWHESRCFWYSEPEADFADATAACAAKGGRLAEVTSEALQQKIMQSVSGRYMFF